MAPPVTTVVKSIDTPDAFVNNVMRKQQRPFTDVLPYSAQYANVIYRRGDGYGFQAKAVFNSGVSWDMERDQAMALAYAKLKDKVSDRASMGENLGQLGSSARLVAEKAGIVLDALRRLRRFDVSAFARWMDTGFLKRNSRFAAQTTLELNFAILPSINDVYSAMQILDSPVKDTHVKARATVPWSQSYVNPSGYSPSFVASALVSAEYGCDVAVTNPNLHLLDAMGLINPAQIAWQLLPGSFLVDWFIPVEQWLGSATDFCGLTLTNAYSTTFVRGQYYEDYRWYFWYGASKFAQTNRSVGIITPNLQFRPLKIAGLGRAANAVSLLIQAFVKR